MAYKVVDLATLEYGKLKNLFKESVRSHITLRYLVLTRLRF